MSSSPAWTRALPFVRRSLWAVLLIGGALLVAWLRLWAPIPVATARVERGLVIEEAFGRGTVESQREAAVGFDLVGRLSDVLVDEGARVTLGQELARLETDQAAADLRSAQTGIAAARSSLRRLAAEEERARAQLTTAEREAGRVEALVARGALSTQQRDEATDRLAIARADLDRVLAQRSEATRGVDVAAGGAEQRRVAMVRATLLAPFDGLVTRRLREPGDTVTVGSTVLRLADTDHVYVSAAMDETVLSRLAVDQPSTISFPGSFPGSSPGSSAGESATIAGTVTRISWEADRQTHEILVEVTPERLDRRIAIGQRADVRIELARHEQALRIPIPMLFHDDSGPYVFVDRGGAIAIARPTLGLSGGEHVEVLEGLSEGDVLLAATRPGAVLTAGRRWRAE